MEIIHNWRVSRKEATGYCNRCMNLSYVVVSFIKNDGTERKLNLCFSHLNEFILELNATIEKAGGNVL